MNRFHAPEQNDYGVYVDVKNCSDEKSFAEIAVRELKNAGIDVPETDSLKDLCGELRDWFKPGNKRLLLLIDESDNLLSELAKDDYASLIPLETLCRGTESNFKFVFAGLHNVFLAANDANTIFGHFGEPLCIRPMSPADAYKLLARPLKYLGFNTDPEMLLRLLVNTNFYPGVVHSVGAKLVEMLTNKYEEHYDDRKNPPYDLTERQISAIMNSADLAALIEERIRMTLNVDAAYSMLSRCIALLYYFEEDKRGAGYSIETILEYARDLKIDALCSLGKDKCAYLLSELREMSILVETNGLYRFRQSRFLGIVGKSVDDIMEQLSVTKGNANAH
jgi:hypothetical protein